MLRKRTLVFLTVIIFLLMQTKAQISPGFDASESIDMIKLCTSYTFQDLYNSDNEIIPVNYQKYYTSEIFGMDNKYQIFLKDSNAIICFRGSTANKISWLENMQTAMIPSAGIMTVNGIDFPYRLAKDSSSAVHAGYTLALAYFYQDVINNIKKLNHLGYYNFIITGHSQGGALSNILRAFLENLPDSILSSNCNFKTYAFAAPMIGNQDFVNEYNIRFCKNKTSYNIVNPADKIPLLPSSFEDSVAFLENVIQFLENPLKVNYKEIAKNTAYKIFNKGVIYYAQRISLSAQNEVAQEIGEFIIPKYVDDINYVYLGNRIEIPSFNYPKVLKDSSLVDSDSSSKKEFDAQLYIEEPPGYQHKPYNYYVSMLEKYFPNRYKMLKKKYLPENL